MNSLQPPIETILSTPPQLSQPDSNGNFSITLPQGCTIQARFEEETVANLEMIYVPENLRNHGIGSLLLQCFLRYCADKDISIVHADFTEEEGIRLHHKVVGEEALHITYDSEEGDSDPPLTTDQAIILIKVIDAHLEANPDDRFTNPAVNAIIDMSKVETSQWQPPIIPPEAS